MIYWLLILFAIIIILWFTYKRIYDGYIEKFSLDETTSFVDISERKSCQELKKNWRTIRNEMLKSRHLFSHIKGDQFFRDIIEDHKWKKIYLKWYNKSPSYAYELFPKLMEIIDAHSEIKLAMFSLLEPGCKILPHKGPFRGVVRVHLSLVTPNDSNCFIVIDGKKYVWSDGDLVGFDDSYEHYVMNNTDRERIILFLDIERRMKWDVINKLIIRFIAPLTTRKNDEIEARSRV